MDRDDVRVGVNIGRLHFDDERFRSMLNQSGDYVGLAAQCGTVLKTCRAPPFRHALGMRHENRSLAQRNRAVPGGSGGAPYSTAAGEPARLRWR